MKHLYSIFKRGSILNIEVLYWLIMDPNREYLKSVDNSLMMAICKREQIIAEKFKGEDWKPMKGTVYVHQHK